MHTLRIWLNEKQNHHLQKALDTTCPFRFSDPPTALRTLYYGKVAKFDSSGKGGTMASPSTHSYSWNKQTNKLAPSDFQTLLRLCAQCLAEKWLLLGQCDSNMCLPIEAWDERIAEEYQCTLSEIDQIHFTRKYKCVFVSVHLWIGLGYSGY